MVEERLNKSNDEVDVLKLPSRKEKHRKKVPEKKKKEFNSMKWSQVVLRTLLFLFIILIITIPITYIYWLQ